MAIGNSTVETGYTEENFNDDGNDNNDGGNDNNGAKNFPK